MRILALIDRQYENTDVRLVLWNSKNTSSYFCLKGLKSVVVRVGEYPVFTPTANVSNRLCPVSGFSPLWNAPMDWSPVQRKHVLNTHFSTNLVGDRSQDHHTPRHLALACSLMSLCWVWGSLLHWRSPQVSPELVQLQYWCWQLCCHQHEWNYPHSGERWWVPVKNFEESSKMSPYEESRWQYNPCFTPNLTGKLWMLIPDSAKWRKY